MIRFLVPFSLFLTSCSLHLSSGLIDPGLGARRIFKETPKGLSAFHTSIQAESSKELGEFIVSIGAGPSVTTPLDGRSPMYGGEISNRVQWRAHQYFQPYIYHAHGLHYHDSKWYEELRQNPVEAAGSSSRYEFSTRVGAGVAIAATDSLTLTVDYSWMHFSSGQSVLGDNFRQFFHLPKADTNDGFEAGAIFIGVQYRW
jgi:opacity protein-like surface antigen